jgi:hypothetical protein
MTEKWTPAYKPISQETLDERQKQRDKKNPVTDRKKADAGKLEHSKFETIARVDGALDIRSKIHTSWGIAKTDWCARMTREWHGMIIATEYPFLSNMRYGGVRISGFVDTITFDEVEFEKMSNKIVESGTMIKPEFMVYPVKIIDFKTTSETNHSLKELHIAQTILYSYILEERSENIRVSSVAVLYYNASTGKLTSFETRKRPSISKFMKKLGLDIDTSQYESVEKIRREWECALTPKVQEEEKQNKNKNAKGETVTKEDDYDEDVDIINTDVNPNKKVAKNKKDDREDLSQLISQMKFDEKDSESDN